MQDQGAVETFMFGGTTNGPDQTRHACPGYKLAMGVMLGTLVTLLRAGTLRAVPASPMSLTLRR